MPCTIPVDEPTDPIVGAVLAHVPPVGAPVRVVLDPIQVKATPDIVGEPLMVTIVLAAEPQPVL